MNKVYPFQPYMGVRNNRDYLRARITFKWIWDLTESRNYRLVKRNPTLCMETIKKKIHIRRGYYE